MNTLRLNRVLSPLTVLGPGRRMGVWVQGCTLGCTGCASVDTWDAGAGTAVDVPVLADRLVATIHAEALTGLSLTGGEPFQQAAPVAELVERVREQVPSVDVLVFTGYAADAARRLGPRLWAAVDALVAGPYLPGRPGSEALRASANQRLLLTTDLGRERFADFTGRTRLQVTAADGDLYVVGLPAPGDLDRLEERLAERGVALSGVTWRS